MEIKIDKRKTILNEIKKTITQDTDIKIDRIILFGSQASGKAEIDSDYDILIILENDYDWKTEDKIFDLCFDIDLKYEVVSDIKIISKKELVKPRGKQAYIQNAINYGISL